MYLNAEANPIGDWTGGTEVDTGAVNRKLGSDNFSADGKAYYKISDVHIELCTDAKDPAVKGIVEAVLDEHGIFMKRRRCRSTPRNCMRSCIHFKRRFKTLEIK